MDSQSQEFRPLARVKRKRMVPKQQPDNPLTAAQPRRGTVASKSGMASFIQAALCTSDGSTETKMASGQEAVSVRGKRSGGHKGCPRVKKRLGLGEKRRLAAVKWPGYEEEVEGEEEGDIEGYSDSDSDLQEDPGTSSDEIEDYLDQPSGSITRDADFTRNEKGKQLLKSRKDKRVHTSTPCHTEAKSLAESIESPSSDEENTHPPSQPSPIITLNSFTPTPATRGNTSSINQGLATPFESPPEYTTIATPPSSPELVTMGDRTKTSDWIKQVQLESMELSKSGDLTHINEIDSTRRGRGKKFVAGGLAERLQRILNHENSEVTFWEHQSKEPEERDKDLSSSVTVQVLSLTSCYSLFVTRCHILESSPMPQPRHDNPQSTTQDQSLMDASECPNLQYPLDAELGTNDSSSSIQASTERGGLLPQSTAGSVHPTSGHEVYSGAEVYPSSDSGRLSTFQANNRSPLAENEPTFGGSLQVETSGGENHHSLHGIDKERTLSQTHTLVAATNMDVRNSNMTVLFSLRCAKYLNLHVGSHVRIYPPWQSLSLPSYHTQQQQLALLCTHYCLSVGHSAVDASLLPTSPVPCKQKGVGGVHALLSPEKAPRTLYSMLYRSPIKGLLPTRLFSGKDLENNAHADNVARRTLCKAHGFNTSVRSVVQGGHRKMEPCSLIDALEHSHCGMVSFTARVVRVYRRKVPSREDTNQLFSVCQSFMRRAKQRETMYHCRWVLLVCDVSGVFSELQILKENQTQWLEVIRCGESQTFHFVNVRVTQRTNPSKNPDLFSFISSLKAQFYTETATPSQGSTQNSSQWGTRAPFQLSFCYQLVCQADCKALLCLQDQELPRIPPTPVASSLEAVDSSRVSFLARILLIHLEVSQESEEERHSSFGRVESSRTCGYYLFVATRESTGTVRVYLKPGFSVSGLEKVLGTPGARVLLRDVQLERKDTSLEPYSMDACSLVVPVDTENLEPILTVYPQRSFSSDELCTLDSITTPDLPLLEEGCTTVGTLVQASGYIVGVDEDNAYSWPTCDMCGNSKLGSTNNSAGELYCDDCNRPVLSPSVRVRLAIFLKSSTLGDKTISVELLQSTIHQLLPVTTTSIEDGFDVHCVLNKMVSLQACYIVESNHLPGETLCLEEVDVQFTDTNKRT